MGKAFQSGLRGAYGTESNASLGKDGLVRLLDDRNLHGSWFSSIAANSVRCPGSSRKWIRAFAASVLVVSASLLGGCGDASQTAQQEQSKPAEPPVPTEVQSSAEALLGSETTVLLYGDLAKNGKQQFLAANVVPKTPKNTIPGTVVTRAVIAEKEGNQWNELFRCDEYLKNAKGFLGMTPLEPVTGWRLQYEQDPEKGLALYLTPVKGVEDRHVLPIGVRWNPATKRYQSLDRSYEHFLLEAPSLSNSRSQLR